MVGFRCEIPIMTRPYSIYRIYSIWHTVHSIYICTRIPGWHNVCGMCVRQVSRWCWLFGLPALPDKIMLFVAKRQQIENSKTVDVVYGNDCYRRRRWSMTRLGPLTCRRSSFWTVLALVLVLLIDKPNKCWQTTEVTKFRSFLECEFHVCTLS